MTSEAALPDPKSQMRSIIQRIATGPELSKDISFDEARDGMRTILDGRVDPVQAAIFLIALRMKRETSDENCGVLQALLDVAEHVTADVDEVLDIADPYDGYTRGLPVSPFLPAVMAACGVPSISHGAESIGPKYGATHRKVLRAAGLPVDLTAQEAAQRLADPDCGWAYVDQRRFCAPLHDLVPLRTLIVKRPCITTVEVLIKPVSGRKRTTLMTGYVHKPYPPIYTMLARLAGYHSAMIVRGVEGGVIPSLQQPAKIFHYRDDGHDEEWRIEPSMADINDAPHRAPPLPETLPEVAASDEIATTTDADAVAAAAAEAGVAALQGELGPVRDGLIYAGALALTHLQRFNSVSEAASQIREVLDKGDAYSRLGLR